MTTPISRALLPFLLASALWCLTAGARANVVLEVGVRLDAASHGASDSTDELGSEAIHGSAAASKTGNVIDGHAHIGPGGSPACTPHCAVGGDVLAFTEFDTKKGVFRGYATGGASVAAGISDVGGAAAFRLEDEVLAQGPLLLDLHLNWSFSHTAIGPASAVAGAFMNYAVSIAPLGCGPLEGCDEQIFNFQALAGSGIAAGWQYDCLVACTGASGSGKSGTLDITLTLPVAIGTQFNLYVAGQLQADCGIYLFDPGTQGCSATASAYQSAYAGLRGDFVSSNGYRYLGYTPPVPEPGSAGLLALGLAALWRAARRRTGQTAA